MFNITSRAPYGSIFASHNSYEVFRTEDGVELEIELPGLSPEEVDVTVEGETLKINAEGGNERRKISFHKQFSIDGFDKKTVKPVLKNGILTIGIERAKSMKPNKVKVLTA